MMKVDPQDLVSVLDIAQLFGVGQSAVSNWLRRHADFPQPVATVANGNTKLWLKSDILQWYRKRITPAERKRILDNARRTVALLEEFPN